MGRASLQSSLRRIVPVLALAGLVASPLASQGVRRGLEQRSSAGSGGNGFGTYHAIIFAVGEQQPASGLPSLRFPLKEADSLRAVITREYTFDPKHVQVVRNPTREAILDTLEVLARRLGPDDNLLVVYSGHGGFDEAGREGYWLAADAANSRPSTWIPNESIRTWLRKLKARSVLLITDACFSGSLNRSNDDRVDLPADNQRAIAGALMYARRTSRQAMTAGTAKETVPQVSIFSMEIVAALKHRRSPVFLAQQLAAEINPRVAAVAHTTPTFSAVPGIESDQGDFVFVRRESASDVAAAPMPTTQPDAGVRRGTPMFSTPSSNTTPLPIVGTVQAAEPAPRRTTPTSAPMSSGSISSKMGNIGTPEVAAAPTGSSTAAPAPSPATTPARPAASKAAPGCDGGVASGCVTLALKLEYGRDGQTQNVPRAVGLYRLACDAGDGDGCMNLGRMYDSRHDGVSMDRGKARQLFGQACDAGSGTACTLLGIATSKGEGGPVDHTKAALLFAKGCDGGNQQGCGLLGQAYMAGRGTAQNETRGRSLLQSACLVNDPAACGGLGNVFANARAGAPRDSVKAVGYWRTACTGSTSIAESCANLGSAYLAGSGIAKDDSRAVQYFSQSCEGGYASGCTLLAAAYESGTTATAKSPTRAAEFYKRGCDGGDQKACTWVTAHPQAAPKK